MQDIAQILHQAVTAVLQPDQNIEKHQDMLRELGSKRKYLVKVLTKQKCTTEFLLAVTGYKRPALQVALNAIRAELHGKGCVLETRFDHTGAIEYFTRRPKKMPEAHLPYITEAEKILENGPKTKKELIALIDCTDRQFKDQLHKARQMVMCRIISRQIDGESKYMLNDIPMPVKIYKSTAPASRDVPASLTRKESRTLRYVLKNQIPRVSERDLMAIADVREVPQLRKLIGRINKKTKLFGYQIEKKEDKYTILEV